MIRDLTRCVTGRIFESVKDPSRACLCHSWSIVTQGVRPRMKRTKCRRMNPLEQDKANHHPNRLSFAWLGSSDPASALSNPVIVQAIASV